MNERFIMLEYLLKGKKGGSFQELRQSLQISTDEELMQLLILYLDNTIENFNYNTLYQKNKILKKVMNYIDYDKSKLSINDHAYKMLYRDLQTIKEKTEALLNGPKKVYNPKDALKNTKLLIRIIERIDDINLDLEKRDMADLQRNIEMYHFIRELLDNKNAYQFIHKIVCDNPSIVNVKDNDDKYLIEDVFRKFVNSFEQGSDYQEKLYYEKVLKLFLNNANFKVDILRLQSFFNKKIYRMLEHENNNSFEKKGELYLIKEINDILMYKKKEQRDFEIAKENLRTKYQLKYDFDEKENNELNFLIKPNNLEYQDQRNLNIITMDSPKTNCFEDAIYLDETNDGYLFRLYSSDVNAFVFENFFLERRAFNNARMYFLPDNVIKDYLSLTKGRDAYTICHEFRLDKNYDVKSFNAYRALINVKENYKYEDINEKLKAGNKQIEDIYVFTNNIACKRNNQFLKTKDECRKQLLEVGNYNVAGNMIRECSMFVNYYIANNLNLPFICRKRSFLEEVIKDKINTCFSSEKRKQDINLSIKDVKAKNMYYANNDNQKYADFCSPIRKGDSLWNERVLLNMYNKDKIQEYYEKLGYACDKLNDKLERTNEYEKEVKILAKNFKNKVDKI